MSKEREPQHTSLTLEMVSEQACELLLAEGQHFPTLIVQLRDRITMIHIHDLADTSDKRREQMSHIGWLFAEQQTEDSLQDVFLITEAWLAIADDGETIERPSQHPQRKEVLVIAHATPTDQTLDQNLLIHEMHRDTSGKLTSLSQYDRATDEETYDSPILLSFLAGYTLQMSLRNQPPDTIH